VNKPGHLPSNELRLRGPAFVSHATTDRTKALSLCRAIEARGTPCWLSCRDVAPGENYQEAIVRSIRTARAIVLVFSGAANRSAEIKKELSLGSRYHVPLIVFRIEEVEPSDAFAYELSTTQWIDACDDWDKSLDVLAASVPQLPVDDGVEIAAHALPALSRRTRLRRWAATGIATAAISSIIGFALTDWLHNHRAASMRSGSTVLSVALLPFETGSADSTTRAIAFGAHDSLSHALSRSRFAVTEIKAGARPDDQSANFVMSGDVSGTPDKVIATVRMEESAHHITVYSHRFEVPRDQAWSLVDRIGPQVAGSLGWTEPVLLIDRNHPSDPEILKEILGEGSTLETTRRLAARAPDSAVAQMTLAFAAGFSLSDLPRDKRAEAVAYGRRATDRAIALAPEFGGVYIPWCLLHSSVRLIECEDRLRAATVRDPASPWVDHFLGAELLNVGRTGEAVELANHSLSNDPFTPAKIAFAVRTLEETGQPTDAEKLYSQGRRWWPKEDEGDDLFWARADGMISRGDFDALARFENQVGSGNFGEGYEPLGVLPAVVKERNVAAAKRTCPNSQKLTVRSDVCMLVLAELGDADDAFALAELLYPDRVGRSPTDEERIFLDTPWVSETGFLVGPSAASMRRDPRFLELARRLGLLAYWRSGRLPDFCTKAHEPICPRIARGP
jgi:TolB-like protein